ncbi:hypothetical protein GF420_10405 [candidate division GN15 bacterium]|nr:hypothetical protein [candidate division GN15 bacterium]
MKRMLATVVCLVILLCGSGYTIDAAGSAFGNLTTAKTIGPGKANFGGGVGIADATSFFGMFTYGMSAETDFRAKLGLIDADGADTKFTLGVDAKWQMWEYVPDGRHPFDMSLGGMFEYVDYDGLSVWQLGAFVLGSYPIQLQGGGGTLAPYGRVNIRLENLSLDLPPGFSGDDSESNLEFGFHGGVSWSPTEATTLYGEFQLDGNDGVFFGIDFNVM